MKEISIIIPCFNESGNVLALFQRIQAALPEHSVEVVFVDDASTDKTRAEILKLKTNHPNKVSIALHDANRGIAESWRSGIEVARYDLICFIDGDLQNPPEAIANLLEAYDSQHADVVQAVRSSIGRLRNERFLLSRGLNFILNSFLGKMQPTRSPDFYLQRNSYCKMFLGTPKVFTIFKHFWGWQFDLGGIV
jgi:glycosyltransferase involved in cell wall biosynthesis